MTLVNVSNHPSPAWGEAQRAAAERCFERVVDLPGGFPRVPPDAEPEAVVALAQGMVDEIRAYHPKAIFVAGELRLVFALVTLLQRQGLVCVTATTEREAVEVLEPDGSTRKEARFLFVRWAVYPRMGP